MRIGATYSGHNTLRLFPFSVIIAVFFYTAPPAYSQRFMFGAKVAGQITTRFTYPVLPAFHEDRVWTYGPVVMAGLELRAHKFHSQPELRYTRWNYSPFIFFTKPDAFQALIGIAIGK